MPIVAELTAAWAGLAWQCQEPATQTDWQKSGKIHRCCSPTASGSAHPPTPPTPLVPLGGLPPRTGTTRRCGTTCQSRPSSGPQSLESAAPASMGGRSWDRGRGPGTPTGWCRWGAAGARSGWRRQRRHRRCPAGRGCPAAAALPCGVVKGGGGRQEGNRQAGSGIIRRGQRDGLMASSTTRGASCRSAGTAPGWSWQ